MRLDEYAFGIPRVSVSAIDGRKAGGAQRPRTTIGYRFSLELTHTVTKTLHTQMVLFKTELNLTIIHI